MPSTVSRLLFPTGVRMRVCLLLLFCVVLSAHSVAAPAVGEALAEVENDRLFKRADVGLSVVDVKTGEEVFGHGAETPLSPASTTKVITAATALKHLGPTYRFETVLAGDSKPTGAGLLEGNLYIRGGGDPTLVVEKLWKMVLDLELAGVREVNGDLVFDDSRFEPEYALPGWTKQEDIERGPAYFPTLSALSVNFNTVALIVRPGASAGEAAHAGVETPADGYVEVVNEVVTGAAGGRRSIRIVREVLSDGMRFTVKGSIPEDGKHARYYRTVAEPTAHFMAVFQSLLQARGIAVSGKATRGITPERAESLVRLQSRPLVVILMDTNKFSNNFMAEQVLRTVGAEVEGGTGSTAKGLAVVGRYLDSLGLAAGTDYALVNGSGLSYDARLSATALVTVLLDMHRDRLVGPEFTTSLAIAGLDGTLSDRLDDSAGLVRGKTGTVNGVHCLAGYVHAGDGRTYAFAFLVNQIPGGISQVKQLHDRFARTLLKLTPSGRQAQAQKEP